MRFAGEKHHRELASRIGIRHATVSRDLAPYKDSAPCNIDKTPKGKAYVQGLDLSSMFDLLAKRGLSWLNHDFCDGEPLRLDAWVVSECPSWLKHLDLRILEGVTPANPQECPPSIEYHSIVSSRHEREITSPFAVCPMPSWRRVTDHNGSRPMPAG